jgi:hypothetical protein
MRLAAPNAIPLKKKKGKTSMNLPFLRALNAPSVCFWPRIQKRECYSNLNP